MKIFSRIEGSLCGAILSPRKALSLDSSNRGHSTTLLGSQARFTRRQQARDRRNTSKHRRAEDDFFKAWTPPPALVKTGSYPSKAPSGTSGFAATQIATRWSHSYAAEQPNVEEADKETDKANDKDKDEAADKDNDKDQDQDKDKDMDKRQDDERLFDGFAQNKEAMLRLVDQLQEGTVDDYLTFQRDPFMRGYAPPDGPKLAVSNRTGDKEFPDFSQVRGGRGDPVQQKVAKLWQAIQSRLRNPFKTDIDHVYSLYEQLPEPRIPYLHSSIRHNLLMVLGREDKNRTSMLRYFAVVADIQSAGLKLTRAEWNSCVAFAARWAGFAAERESSAALRMWKEMEADAGIQGNAVTFNILFDVASKAGNFMLAEMLYKEMERRNLPWNRYHHVSLIHFFGLKMDSDGIRAAYKEMVEAGELIDSTVLNCVIAGFLRCGEEYAAQRVYERMKAAHARTPTMPYRNYMKDQVVTKVLMMLTKISKKTSKTRRSKSKPNGDIKVNMGRAAEDASKANITDDSEGGGHDVNSADLDADAESEGDGGALRKHFQKQSPITPNFQTYRIFVNHYAVRMSALEKVAHFLDDMKWFHVPLHGAIFLALFKGFAIHGGPGQRWRCEQLVLVYDAFRSALAENANGIYVDAWMARWILRAFHKCDTEDKVLEVWMEMKPRCQQDFDPRDIEHFEDFVVDLLKLEPGRSRYVDKGMFWKSSPKRRRVGRHG